LRNRWKRLLREAFRIRQNDLPAIDYVCVPRSASPPDLSQLTESFSMLASRLERKLQSRRKAPQPDGSTQSRERSSPAIEPSL
jgi:ribonuclease P protein component